MKSSRAKRYDSEFKIQIVLALLRNEASHGEISRKYQVSMNTLTKWKEEFLKGGTLALRSGGNAPEKNEIQKLKKEIEKRDQIIGELTVANQLLKKSLMME